MGDAWRAGASFWPLSSYAPRTLRAEPSNRVSGETSFEELRWFTYQSLAAGRDPRGVFREVVCGVDEKAAQFARLTNRSPARCGWRNPPLVRAAAAPPSPAGAFQPQHPVAPGAFQSPGQLGVGGGAPAFGAPAPQPSPGAPQSGFPPAGSPQPGFPPAAAGFHQAGGAGAFGVPAAPPGGFAAAPPGTQPGVLGSPSSAVKEAAAAASEAAAPAGVSDTAAAAWAAEAFTLGKIPEAVPPQTACV